MTTAKTRKKKNKKRGITREQIWKIWETISPRDWYDFFNNYRRESRVEFAGDATLKALCPLPNHADTTPSFFIFTAKGYAKCFGCDFYTSNPIHLLSVLMDGTDSDAIQFLNERYNLSFLPKKATEELQAQKTNQDVKQAIVHACNQIMCKAIAEPAKYPFAKDALNWLLKERQIPVDVVHALPVGILPPLTELGNVIEDNYQRAIRAWEKSTVRSVVPPANVADAAVDYLSDSYSAPFTMGGIVWPLHVTPAEIGRLKIRAPHSQAQKDILIPVDEFEDLLGLFGLGWEPYQTLLDPKKMGGWAYLTEGEMDVMTYMAQVLKSGNPQLPLFSVGGKGGSAHIEPIFKAAGFDGAYLIGDSPAKGSSGGNVVVQFWLQRIRELQTRVFVGWDKLGPSKDIDEAILQHGLNTVESHLWKDAESNFVPAWQWATELALEAIHRAPNQDYRNMIEIAATIGSCLRHRHDVEKYAIELSRVYDEITIPILKREIASSEDTETGFILRCTDALRDHFAILATRRDAGNRILVMYAKKEKEYRQLKLDSEQAIAQELAPTTGSLLQFIREEVGFPSFLDDPETLEGQSRRRADLNIRYYLKEACLDLAKGVRDIAEIRRLRQGYHYIPMPEGKAEEFVVCGKDVIHFDRTESGTPHFKYLDGPSYKEILFDVGFTSPAEDTRPWFPGGLSPEILHAAIDLDVNELFHKLEHLFDVGFQFAAHDVMPRFLAAQLLLMPIMDAFDRQMFMFVTGETSSGKSNLLSIFGGVQVPNLKLNYSSQGIDEYSKPGVVHSTDRDSRTLALDEFELDGHRRDHCIGILEILRGIVTGQSRRVVGRKDGQGYRAAYLGMSVMLAGIAGAERPQDLNRMLIIEMSKRASRDSPENIIMKEYGPEGIKQLARQATTILYPRAHEIKQHYEEIKRQFPQLNALLPFKIEWRYASSLFGVLALLKYLNHDWQEFLHKFVARNATTIHRAATINESDSLFKELLHTRNLYIFDQKRKISAGALLGNANTREEINTQSCGFFFDENSRHLLILVSQAMSVLLDPTHAMARASKIRVRDILERHELALKPKDIEALGIIDRARPYMGGSLTIDDVVVLRPGAWLNETSRAITQMDAPTSLGDDDSEEDAEIYDVEKLDKEYEEGWE